MRRDNLLSVPAAIKDCGAKGRFIVDLYCRIAVLPQRQRQDLQFDVNLRQDLQFYRKPNVWIASFAYSQFCAMAESPKMGHADIILPEIDSKQALLRVFFSGKNSNNVSNLQNDAICQ